MVCQVCGYGHKSGENAPAECPVCHVGLKFEELKGEMVWADEHSIRCSPRCRRASRRIKS